MYVDNLSIDTMHLVLKNRKKGHACALENVREYLCILKLAVN